MVEELFWKSWILHCCEEIADRHDYIQAKLKPEIKRVTDEN